MDMRTKFSFFKNSNFKGVKTGWKSFIKPSSTDIVKTWNMEINKKLEMNVNVHLLSFLLKLMFTSFFKNKKKKNRFEF